LLGEKKTISIELRKHDNSLLVRIGQNATELDHLVEYGKNSTAMIHEQLQKKRRANTSSTRQSSKHVYYKCDIASCGSLVPSDLVGCCKANVVCNSYRFCSNHLDHDSYSDVNVKRSCREKYDSSMSVVDDLHHIEESGVCVFLCDIEECIEPALQSSAPCEHQHCGNYVFCDMHQLHESHSIGHTMRSKREMFQATATLNRLTSVDKANKKKKKKTCQGSTLNSIAVPIISSTAPTLNSIAEPILGQQQSAMNQTMRSNRPANKNKLLAWISQSNNFLAQTNAYIAYNVEEEADE